MCQEGMEDLGYQGVRRYRVGGLGVSIALLCVHPRVLPGTAAAHQHTGGKGTEQGHEPHCYIYSLGRQVHPH